MISFKLLRHMLTGLLALLFLTGMNSKERKVASVEEVTDLIEQSNSKVKRISDVPCINCSFLSQPFVGIESIIRKTKVKIKLANSCSKIMNTNGDLGPIGQSIFSIMSEDKYRRYFTARNSMGSFCPNFNNLTDEEKLMAYTWFWTGLAQNESSCTVNKKHGTTYRDRQGRIHVLNPRQGYGLWAMEKDPNVRRYRGKACKKISTAAGQARCAIDIMVKTQLKKGRSAVSNRSYWGPVRKGQTKILPHMRRLRLCF